jgi:tRNA A37 threonylcarbamoyladenosine modification protein TsaB
LSYSAAIDFSGPEVAFAIGENKTGQLITEAFRTMSGREGASLLNWLSDVLTKKKLTMQDITSWTVGNGPGSFTGLRLAASLVNGLCYQQPQVKTRGISSALALAAWSADDTETGTIGIVFKGKIDDLLIFTVEKENGKYSISNRVIVPHTAVSLDTFKEFNILVSLKQDWPSLEPHLPEELLSSFKLAPHVPVDKMLFLEATEQDSTSIIDLDYIRPAVHTAPKPKRDIPTT